MCLRILKNPIKYNKNLMMLFQTMLPLGNLTFYIQCVVFIA